METIKKYNKHQLEVNSKIDILKDKLKKHQSQFEENNSNWGYIGDIDYINKKLDEILEFFNSN
jgi:hypothetical protein